MLFALFIGLIMVGCGGPEMEVVMDTPIILKKGTNDLGKFDCNTGHNKMGRLFRRRYVTASDYKLPFFPESDDALTSKSPPVK